MEVDGNILKRKSTYLDTSYDRCIICQDQKKEELEKSTENKLKIRDYILKRRKGRDFSNVATLDRLCAIPEKEWSKHNLRWHNSCFSAFTNVTLLNKQQDLESAVVQHLERTTIHDKKSVSQNDYFFCLIWWWFFALSYYILLLYC